jgi:hypothetical protein
MPNWVTNTVVISGSPEELTRVFELGFDFQKILPCPYFDSTGTRSTDARWYEWCVSHWGTKWPADDVTLLEKSCEDDDTLRVRFYTAWNPPTGVLGFLGKLFPTLTITDKYYDPLAGYCGMLVCSKGNIQDVRIDPYKYKPSVVRKFSETCPWFDGEAYLKDMESCGVNLKRVEADSAYSNGPVDVMESKGTYEEFVATMEGYSSKEKEQ